MSPSTVKPRRQQTGDRLPTSLFIPTPLPLPGLTFRLMRPADIHPLHAACYADRPFYPFRESCCRILTRLDQGRSYPLIAENGDTRSSHAELVGHGQLVIYPSVAEIADLIVAPAWRGQGIGTALIAMLTHIARYTRQPSLEIGVHAANQRALALYQRLGFTISREIKLPPGLENLQSEKGLILELPLQAGPTLPSPYLPQSVYDHS